MSELNITVRLRALNEASRTFEQLRAQNHRLLTAFDRNRASLSALNQQLRNIHAHRRQQQSIVETSQRLRDAQQRMQALSQAMRDPAVREHAMGMVRLNEQYQRAQRQIERLNQVRDGQRIRLQAINQALRGAGINVRQLSQEEQRLRFDAQALNNTLTQQQQRLEQLARAQRRHDERLARAGNLSMTGYVALNAAQRGANVLAAPVRQFMASEQASADLKVAMMRADGSTGAFEQLNTQASKLGTILPGTTQDFLNLAKALISQGLDDAVLLNGGLEAAAKLSVLMNMGQEEGGIFLAKMIEAHKLSADELLQAADQTQRAYYAFGLKKEDMAESMKYYAANADTLGIAGMADYEKLLAVQGLAARVGLEGSSFGTNFAQMLNRLNKGTKMVINAKSGMKAEVAEILRKTDVSFEFFDDKGAFKGIDAMVSELEKLNTIKEKLGEQSALEVAQEIFGSEAGRVALILSSQGTQGYLQALNDMNQQADMMMRITVKTSTLGAALEQLGGVWGSFQSALGESIAPYLLKITQGLQRLLDEAILPFIKNNPQLVRFLMVLASALVLLTFVGGGVLLFLSAMTAMLAYVPYWPTVFFIKALIMAVAMLVLNWEQVVAGALRVGEYLREHLAFALAAVLTLVVALIWRLPLLQSALLTLGRFVLPLAPVLAFAAALYWVWLHWDKISRFLREHWYLAMGLVGAGVVALKGSFAALWAVMLANPVTSIVAAVMGLMATLVLLVKHWDLVKDAANRAWEAMQKTGGAMGTWLADKQQAGIMDEAMKANWKARGLSEAEGRAELERVTKLREGAMHQKDGQKSVHIESKDTINVTVNATSSQSADIKKAAMEAAKQIQAQRNPSKNGSFYDYSGMGGW